MSYSWSPRYRGNTYHGLVNQGSTCYLNSVLQVLFMTRDFREALKSCDTGSFDSDLKELFDELKHRTCYTYKITKKLGITRDFVQGDAAECLENILSHVSSPGASQLFKGCLTQKDKCSKCETETNTDDPFWSLPLELVDDHSDYSVVDGITRYFSESDVSGPNQLFCDTCGDKTDSTIKSEMKHHPEVLTLLLKRFQFDFKHMDYVKIKRNVKIPYILEIPNTGSESQLYELYAIVDHIGSLRNGHYTAVIKPQDDDKWYDFNDTRVSLLPFQPFQLDVIQTSPYAYLLFYRKVSAADTLTETTTEVSTSAASKLDTKDKNELDKHDVEDRGKGDEGETAAVNHQSTDRQEIEEKSKAGVRVNREEGVTVEEPLNREKMIDQRKTESQKLWKIADLCSPTERGRGESRGKQESSTINQKERLEVSDTIFGRQEQERKENGGVENKRTSTDDEHSQREKMDVTNKDCYYSDAVQHSGRFDDAPNSTVRSKEQSSSGIHSHYLIVKETGHQEKTYLILKKGFQQSADDGDNQGSKQNIIQESKVDVKNHISHISFRPRSSSELNTKTRESDKAVKNVQTRGKHESYCETEGPASQLNETASKVCSENSYTSRFFYPVTGYQRTYNSFQSGDNTRMPQSKEVSVTAECDEKPVEALVGRFQNFHLSDTQEPQGHSHESIRGKTESSTERQSLNELKAENTAEVSPSVQIRDETEEPRQSERRGLVCGLPSCNHW